MGATEGRRVAVVGAGPNGLTTAALLARAGFQVDVFEQACEVGGACTSAERFPGATVDLGAAAHPFGVASPVFQALELERFGLTWRHPSIPLAHPLDDAPAALLHRNLEATASELGSDERAWLRLHRHLVERIDAHLTNVLGPMLRLPPHPITLARFGLPAMCPARALGHALFREDAARALLAGSAAHVSVPLSKPLTASFAHLLNTLGMTSGWPVAEGGSGAITRALAAAVKAHGGRIHLGQRITSLRQLPARTVVLNLTPRQVLALDAELPQRTRRRLARWRYGPGSYKIDYLLDAPVPWADPRVGGAGTVHVGGTLDEIHRAEVSVAVGTMPTRPFVLVCQQQVADSSRASAGHVVWAYTHVPHGYEEPEPGYVQHLVTAQIERFAPGFANRIVDAHRTTASDLERWNPNLVGGDIAGGSMAGLQALLRPGMSLTPYTLSKGRLYLASAATPPGAGVHGMAGAWAARAVIRGA
ncbi:NAD(P)/FAD-dependent oxidoreductase [uncultured Tessaracoccus sp.]|uniref:phytoene desaturase family protein n=1 Tax=uncultured Tessaracoccus sp. TaxID=905023 RepID=UPI00261B0396|nr:NAD(P)/FAD-dependent oxidoreductase [uncultured Tessaracoccus sp.]